MIDYELTFIPPAGFEVAVLYDLINGLHDDLSDGTLKPLMTVHVADATVSEARAAAIELLSVHGPVENELRNSIAAELSAFDHLWRPTLTELDERFDGDFDSVDRRVATFVYGGLLFGAFAAQAGAAHCLHSKRRRLDLAVAIDAPSAGFDAEAELRTQLDRMIAEALGPDDLWIEGLAAIPPVLPYLLTRYEPDSLNALVLHALELRKTDLVASFRHWKEQALSSVRRAMVPPRETEREMREVALALRNHLAPAAKGWTTVFRYIPFPEAWRDRLWSWTLRNLPGRGHMKLLFELQVADRPYTYAGRVRALEHSLARLWSASGVSLNGDRRPP